MEFVFKLSATAKEYPSRFGGNEVTLTMPDDLAGIRALVADGVDSDAAIYGLCVGQGLRLTLQKRVKDVLGSEKVTINGTERDAKDVPVPEMLAHAVKEAQALKIGAHKPRGEGKGSKKVAEAEAKAETATNALRDTYLAVPAAVRKTLRPGLVAKFGEETVAGWEAAK